MIPTNGKMITVIGLMMAVAIACYLVVVFHYGELSEKDVWALLQRVEIEHRNDLNRTEMLVLKRPHNSKYMLVGIPSDDAKYSRAWLVLNRTDRSGSIMIMADDPKLKMRCSDVSDINKELKIEPTVLKYLESICRT